MPATAGSSGKTTTGIVGLPVVPNALEELSSICDKILEEVKDIPSDAPYRTNVETMYTLKKSLAQQGDVAALEAELGLGQIEEVIEIAKDELSLAAKYKEWKLYE